MTIGKKMGSAFGLVLIIPIAMSLTSYWSTRKVVEANHFVNRRLEALSKEESLLAQLVDAETGQRGYIITGDEQYLEPYKQALNVLPGTLAELRKTVAENPLQEPRLNNIEPLIQKKLDQIKETIELRKKREGGFEAASEVVKTREGKETMDKVRQIIQ